MDYFVHFFFQNGDTILSGIFVSTILGILSLVKKSFRKAILSTFQCVWRRSRRTYKKIRRFRLSHILPKHTLEHIKLKRQLRELAVFKKRIKEQNEELEKNLSTLLSWASKFRYFGKDAALNAMRWKRPYTHMIFGLAIKRELIRLIDNKQALFSITTEGRELLFRKELLQA